MNGMNSKICCFSPVQNVGLNISSPILRKSAFGLVKDCPSSPKAVAATTFKSIRCYYRQTIAKSLLTSVVYFAANCNDTIQFRLHSTSTNSTLFTSLTSNSNFADSGPLSMYSKSVFVMLLMYGIAVRTLWATKSGDNWLLLFFHPSPGTTNGFMAIRGSSCRREFEKFSLFFLQTLLTSGSIAKSFILKALNFVTKTSLINSRSRISRTGSLTL